MKPKKQLWVEMNNGCDPVGFFVYLELVYTCILYARTQENYEEIPKVRFGEMESGPRGSMRKSPFFEKKYGGNIFDYFFYFKTEVNESTTEVRKNQKFWRWIHTHFGPETYPRGATYNLRKLYGTPYVKEIDEWYGTNRTTATKVLEEHIGVKNEVWNKVNAIWDTFVTKDDYVIGVHIRGTDKIWGGKKIIPSEYFPYIDYFVKYKNAKICLATDDPKYLSLMEDAYGDSVFYADCQRHDDNIFLVDDGSPYAKGLEVLVDSLLLSKCDFLLKSSSAVSEFSIYFNPKLINNNLNLQYNCSHFLFKKENLFHVRHNIISDMVTKENDDVVYCGEYRTMEEVYDWVDGYFDAVVYGDLDVGGKDSPKAFVWYEREHENQDLQGKLYAVTRYNNVKGMSVEECVFTIYSRENI